MRTLRPITLARPAAAALAAVLAAGLSACGSGAPRPVGASIEVVERDFHITAPKQVPAGRVTIRLVNRGPDAHELLVVRVPPTAALPMRADGMTVDEGALQRATLAALEPGKPGSVRTLRLRLLRGDYVLFCNMAGHFMGGMSSRMAAR